MRTCTRDLHPLLLFLTSNGRANGIGTRYASGKSAKLEGGAACQCFERDELCAAVRNWTQSARFPQLEAHALGSVVME